MSQDEADWELFYWKGYGPGRGEFVRLVFIEAGVPFKQMNDNEKNRELFKNKKLTGYPCFAVPMIKKGDFQLCQTPVICKYLGKKFGLYPETEEDIWHAEQVNATVHDYIAEGRLAFHGIDHTASYFGQEEGTKPYIERFIKTRLPSMMETFEVTLKANGGGNGFLFGSKLTYVDLGLLHILRATEAQFPEAWAALDKPLLKAFKNRLEARPKLAAWFKSEECEPFSGNSMM
ncbi:unnamed protein product [Owenia fusiformis]|nr:unnamed protein product [Owenia fusiformis]